MNEVRNLHPDPRCLRQRETWNGGATANGEKWRYELSADSSSGSVFAWNGLTNQFLAGKVLYARVTSSKQAVLDGMDIESASLLVRRNGWVAARVADGLVGNHTIWLRNGPFVLQEVGCYSPEDWEQLYALYQRGDIQFPWVAGPRDATTAGQVGPWEL